MARDWPVPVFQCRQWGAHCVKPAHARAETVAADGALARCVAGEVVLLEQAVAQQPDERIVELRHQRVAQQQHMPWTEPPGYTCERRVAGWARHVAGGCSRGAAAPVKGLAAHGRQRARVGPPAPRDGLQAAQPLGGGLAVAQPVVVPVCIVRASRLDVCKHACTISMRASR